MSDSRWYFTEEQLANSPSRKCGINAEQELSYRQRAANLIQEIGQRLQVSQLCINTAIVYMHRFYAFHSFNLFHRNSIAAAAFFLAAKVEEQPRKLEHVIKILNICLEKSDTTREAYAEQAQELVFNENVLLQTLGFDVAIDHPHTHVVRACQLFNIVTVSRELRQTCYFMASNSLHLTTMCLKYKPTVVAAFCIYIACKWSRWEIPDSSEGKAWYSYVDENVTTDTLKKLTDEYLEILEKSPSKFKSKMKAITSNGQTALNTNPSVHARDDVPTTSSKHHHHHHHNRSTSGGATSGSASRKQPSGEISTSAPTSSSRQLQQQQQQASAQASGGSYKNQSMPQPGSTTHLPRQRPSSSSSSQQPTYPGSSQGSSNSDTQKPVNEDRTQHRQVLQEPSSFGSSMMPRQVENSKQRTSSSQSAANLSSSSQQQTNHQHQPPHVKSTNHEQRHSLSSKPQVDYHPKSTKNPSSSQSSANSEFQNRSSSSVTHSQQAQQQPSHKKPSWPQQQQQSSHPNNPQKSSQSNIQTSHSQPNLGSTSANSRSSSQSLPSYNESTKQTTSSQPSNTQNDFWFNDKILDTTVKPISPPRQLSKSMFSPSPEHEAFDRTKLMLMNASNVKRNNSPKNEKQERRSSTPNKREKRSDLSTTPTSQKSSQSDRKLIPKLENSNVPPLIPDAGAQMKKRPYSSIDDALAGEYHRESKTRKLEPVKSEPLGGPMMKQPIETNPEVVKSLLQECYTTSKFDSFGMDSPLDVINPDPTMPITSFQPKVEFNESLPSLELRDNGLPDDHHKRTKSKKKKDKHKKKKKNHKSDREDRDDRKDSSLKITFSKDKSDSKSSPESVQTPGGLKIKIPMKDVNKTDLAGAPPPMTAPLKLKISKEKMGNFTQNPSQNLSDGGSSSSSSHKKKEKDRSKSKSSKHGTNNNIPDFKDAGFQHQQLSVNKMSSQVPIHQNPSASTVDLSAMFGHNSFPPHQQQQQQQSFYQQPPNVNLPQQQQHHLQQQPQQQFNNFNDFYQNSNMSYSSHNNSNNGSGSKK